jgi:phosphate transport system substrate-binding protein
MRIIFLGLMMVVLQASSLFALTLAGTGDSELLLQGLAAEYHRLYPERVVEVPPSVGSGGGIRMLLQGRTDLARVARPLSQKEQQKGLVWRKFALDPIVFVANLPQKCIADLKDEQLLNIFNGSYGRWSQLGNCPDQKIFLARREAGDSSNRILYEEIAGLRKIASPAGRTIYTTPETLETIVSHPYTLGYLPLSQASHSSLIQFSLNGVKAGPATISDKSYRLLLPLALVWKEPLQEDAKLFLHFLESPIARELISLYGAVPVSEQDQ